MLGSSVGVDEDFHRWCRHVLARRLILKMVAGAVGRQKRLPSRSKARLPVAMPHAFRRIGGDGALRGEMR